MRWGKIRYIYYFPRLFYNLSVVVTLEKMDFRRILNNRRQVDKLGQSCKSYDIERPSYDSRARLYDFIAIVCRETEIIVGTKTSHDHDTVITKCRLNSYDVVR